MDCLGIQLNFHVQWTGQECIRAIRATMPYSFKTKYPNRHVKTKYPNCHVIIDYTEKRTETFSSDL